MRPKPMLMQQLKVATEQEHRLTEEVSYGESIRTGSLQIGAYRDLILKNALIHQQFERGIQKALEKINEPLLHQFFRQRSQELKKDIETLNLSTEQQHTPIPSFSIEPTVAHIFGTLYVVEGSMLGNQYIAKALRQNEHLQTVEHFHFYQKDEETGNRWRAFQQMAEDLAIKDSEAAIEAAKKTFQYFRTVFQLNLIAVQQDTLH